MTVNVVKIGGNVIDDPDALNIFLHDFAALAGRKILVHGGGKEASRICRSLGIEPVMVDGRRVTDAATLDVVTMVYAGLINKRITASLQNLACDAIGLTGADGDMIPAVRRSPQPVDYGFVGDIEPGEINSRLLRQLLEDDYTPVFCAICHDGNGSLLNCNADSVAAAVAIAASGFADVRLFYCFERPGVLTDVEDNSSVVPLVTPEIFEELKGSGAVAAGMLPKLHNALDAARRGVGEVVITDYRSILSGGGTSIIWK